jgi:hypothetical protein
MSDWLKDGDSLSAEANGLGVTSVTERYVVFGPAEPSAVVAAPSLYQGGMAGEVEPLPVPGSAHPNFPSLRLLTCSAQRVNNNVVYSVVYGSSTAIFDREWFARSGSFQTEATPMPYARRVRHTVPSYTGANVSFVPVDQDLWAIETVDVLHTVQRITMQVNIGGAIGAAVQAMRAQNNRVHVINGGAYRFEAGEYFEAKPGVWIVNYNWIGESGILWNDSLTSDANVVFPPRIDGLLTDPGAGQIYVAPPFYSIDAIPDPDSPELPPAFRPRLRYPIEPNGYAQLVGLPPL